MMGRLGKGRDWCCLGHNLTCTPRPNDGHAVDAHRLLRPYSTNGPSSGTPESPLTNFLHKASPEDVHNSVLVR